MKVKVICHQGLGAALLGLGLNYGVTSHIEAGDSEVYGRMLPVANKLAPTSHGHNKFLRQIYVAMDITAPRYWWAEYETYQVGTVEQSESTMHTILKRPIEQADFIEPIPEDYLEKLNVLVAEKNLLKLKAWLPEGFLQRRVVTLNYAVLREMRIQRQSHRLPEWKQFLEVVATLPQSSWIMGDKA